jgi:two-component system LytT family sensor kinase
MIGRRTRLANYPMLEPQQLVVLLLRLAVAASLASILSRFSAFQSMLMREERTLVQRVKLALSCSAAYGAGVATRVFTRKYEAVDLGLEGSLVAGMVGGYVTGLLAGVLISIPALFHGEFMSMPLFAGVGVLGGLLRDIAPEKEDIWRFSPIFGLNPARLRQRQSQLRVLFQLGCLFTIIFAELLRFSAARWFPGRVFSLARLWGETNLGVGIGICASTVFAVMLPLKIWNNTRNEKKLEAQQLRLNEARLAALTSQINPHFLFNTLNSVSSLIRTNPDQARSVVYRLSSILRRLLRKTDNLTPLREELAFIDNYMNIEMVRFGEKLRFVKEIDPETLDRMVPSMMLQPIIENSIRHGLSSKVEGGMIRVRSSLGDGKLQLVVEDDGVGIPEARLATLFEQGIGVSNVNERLKVLFGQDYRMWIDSKPGEGTRTGIEIPDVQVAEELTTAG